MKVFLFLSVCFMTFHLHGALPTKQKGTKMRQKQENTLPIPIPLYDVSGKQSEKDDSDEEDRNEEESSGATPEEEILSNADEDDSQDFGGPKTEEEEEEEEEAELNPKLFEGDLKLSEEEIKKLDESTISKRDAIADAARKWPKARVPFKIHKKFANDKARMRVLKRAIREFKNKTCVRFIPKKKKHKHSVKFVIEKGCYSTSVGKHGGQQFISIGEGCNYLGTVIHEIMHAIGFFHEHTRLDRDQYVTINWDNIKKDRESQFKKYAHGSADYLNEPYDYGSVMHYPRDGFGIKVDGVRLSTIVPKDKPWRKIGQREGFSAIDLRQINKLYNCTEFTSNY